MRTNYQVGDHVQWATHAGTVTGTIQRFNPSRRSALVLWDAGTWCDWVSVSKLSAPIRHPGRNHPDNPPHPNPHFDVLSDDDPNYPE